jgi:uncharacterized membrane protein YfcA
MIAELGPLALCFVVLVCLAAGFAHGAIGFGFPIVATPLVALVIDVRSAIALLAPVTLVVVLLSAVRGGSLMEVLRRFWYLPPVTIAGSWVGTRVLLAAPPEPFLLVLAGVMLLYLNLDRLNLGGSATVKAHPAAFGLGVGFIAGASEAIANVSGPLLLVYFMLLGLTPAQTVQALNLCFMLGKSTQVATWAAAGGMTPALWLAVAAFTVPSVAALLVGMRLRSRIDAATYRRWLRGALWLMTALLIGQFIASISSS